MTDRESDLSNNKPNSLDVSKTLNDEESFPSAV